METVQKRIRMYRLSDGKCPYKIWFECLNDLQAKAVILKRLARVEMGHLGQCNFVGQGVYELKMNCGPGYRIYFGQESKDQILLLCGGIKKTQFADIIKARNYWFDWRQR